MDKKYREELHLTLRLHEVSGVRVGEVLAEVESHVAETGEDPVEAFGPPREYAARVAAELDSKSDKSSRMEKVLGGLGTGLLTYVGLRLLMDGLFPDSDAPPGGIGLTLGDVVASVGMMVLIFAGVMLLFRSKTALARRRVYGVAGAVCLVAGVMTAGVASWLFEGDASVLVIPRWSGIGLGALLIAGAVGLIVRATKRGRVVDPR